MSEVKVNKISPRTNCGTVQLGDSGDTITIPAGATITNNGTQTGFGRTGTVDWQTSIKTSGFTAVSGEGYFCNTTSAAFTVTLPASPSVGDIVAVKDYAGTFDTNNLTLGRNSSNIEGLAADKVLETESLSITFVYADATKGWLAVNDMAESKVPKFVTATGGTVTCSGNFKIHTFTGPGTFTVSCAGNPCGSNTVDYLVVAGGGGAGGDAGGGGGPGGTRFSNGTASGCYTAGPSPLGASALPVSAQAYPITVGGGGGATPAPTAPGPSPSNAGNPGNNSVFSTITSTAGGGGGGHNNCGPLFATGRPGGSGGGARSSNPTAQGGSGNTPPTTPAQGTDGGTGNPQPNQGGGGSGGGGAVCAGQPNQITPGPGTRDSGGNGGAGITSSITASPVGYGGGGGGGAGGAPGAQGGTATQGGGAGSSSPGTPGVGCGTAGTANTGGGGGGGHDNVKGQGGGSGIVIIRYKFQ